MKLTFLAHDSDSNMCLIKWTTDSDLPDINKEWAEALAHREGVPLKGPLIMVGAMTTTADAGIRWYPDTVVDASIEAIGKTLH